ncbi:MAG: hypothetical protein HKM24_02765 [Gammaproteobacteria bacterium]|nr:hypothetical protein [Gammaproteobacteria bacterium]
MKVHGTVSSVHELPENMAATGKFHVAIDRPKKREFRCTAFQEGKPAFTIDATFNGFVLTMNVAPMRAESTSETAENT